MYIIDKIHIYNKVKSIVNQAMLLLCLCLPAAAILLGGSILSSCNADNSISTRYPCQFIFRTIYHPGSTIENALQGAGSYTMVSAKKENYANYSYLGAGNDLKDATKNGFIMGLSNFNGYVAWDRQCLNCILQYGGTNYPLEWTGNRQSVICNKCKRVYSLENGTVTSGGKTKEDKPLMQYRVTYSGVIGSVITVGN